MPVALVTTSHSPLMGVNQPADEVVRAVEAEFEATRRFIASFDPELVVIFAPDHYNGVFYDLLPSFCIGMAAEAVGDYGTQAGPLQVDRAVALELARHVLAGEVDVAVSERMHVDHGFAQPLQLLLGGIAAVPTVPVFINSVAEPLGPAKRARLLGRLIGEVLRDKEERILLIGSGGLSHDPPVPQLEGAPPEVAERLISGRNPTPESRAAREAKVLQAGRDLAAGASTIQPLNPQWDDEFLALLTLGDLAQVDRWSNEWFVEQAGHSSHEVRTWIAAYAALAASGPYEVTSSFYRPVPEWIAGFGITTAVPRDSGASAATFRKA